MHPPRVPRFLLAILFGVAAIALAACASTPSDQSQGQGGSVGPAPQAVGLLLVLGDSSITSTPTAAPAATKADRAEQRADQRTTTAIDPAALEQLAQALGVDPSVIAAALRVDAPPAEPKVPVIGGDPAPAEPPANETPAE